MSEERYVQIQHLRSGTFAKLVLAMDTSTSTQVALKYIDRRKLGGSSSSGVHGENEVLLHTCLRHPHIIQLREVMLNEGHLVLVLDLAAGGDLAGRVPPGAGLEESQARWLLQQLLFALEFVHRMGVAHRDIKLENVLLDSPTASLPLVKLADFGLSVECDAAGRAPFDGAVGTPVYMAPELLERLSGGRVGELYDAKAPDVWSCGVLLLALLTGCSPFQRMADASLEEVPKLQALVRRILSVDYAMPPNISPLCTDLLASMLQRDPAVRPTARQLLLHPWFATDRITASVGPGLLACNDSLVAAARSKPRPEAIARLRGLLAEAAARSLCPATPEASQADGCPLAAATMLTPSSSSLWNNE